MANQRLNIDIVARDKSKQALTGVQKSLGRLKNSVFNLRTAFLGLGAGLVVRNLVNTGKQLENLRVRLKFLLKDTNEGAKAFDNMTKFASKVPFSLEEIQAGAGILATVTDNADDLQEMLEITGNVAAVTGLDFRTAGEQIQRSFSAGIGAADLFREKGVRNMLGFKAGATVSIEETVAAFERVFGKDGRFGKATDELANTFEGTLSMIGDKVFNFKKLLLEAGFFEELKKQFGDLDKFLEDNAKDIDRIATSVGKNLAQGMVRVVQVGKDLIPTINKIGSGLKSIFDGFMAMPEFAREIGIVGAFLLGKKGAVGLASISFVIDKVSDLLKKERIGSGLIDVANIEEANLRLAEINKQLEDGLKKEYEFIDVRGKGTVILEDYKTLTEDQLNLLKKQKLELEDFIKFEKIKNGVLSKSNHHMFEMANNLKKAKEEQKEIIKFTSISNHHMFEMANAVKKTEETFQEMNETVLKNIENKFKNISTIIKESINSGITKMSEALSRSLVFGEKLSDTLRNMALNVLGKIVATLIEQIVRQQIQIAMENTHIAQLMHKLGIEKLITKERQTQANIKGVSSGSSLIDFGLSFLGFAKGGAVSKGQPIVVGEQGAELFVPNQTGQITQSARGTGNGGSTTVNFNINTVDASGFEELLVRSRGTITQLINNAVNERGSKNLI